MRTRLISGLLIIVLAATAASYASAGGRDEKDNGLPGKTGSRTVGLTFGAAALAFKNSAGRDFWAPVILNGTGPHVRLSYRRENPNKLQALGLSLNSIGNFIYDTGVRDISLPEGNRYADFGLEYGLTFYLFRNVLFKNLDMGIGPCLRLEYLNSKRFYAPDIKTRFLEGYADVLFSLSARFRPGRSFRFEAGFRGGFIIGLTRQIHSVSGSMPLLFAAGWQTGIKIEAGIALGRRFILLPTYEYEARSMVWTWGTSYRRWRSLVSLSLSFILGRSR